MNIERSLRIQELRAELDRLLAEQEAEAGEDIKADCIALLKANKYVDAIREYRQRTGYGLREAKDIIDRFQREQA